jgi:hypothetical protein
LGVKNREYLGSRMRLVIFSWYSRVLERGVLNFYNERSTSYSNN